jgi:hypothetical protein
MNTSITLQTYFEETEQAVRHLFSGMDYYDSIKPPAIAQYADETGTIKMSKEEAESLMRISQESMALMFSRATLAGSILQVAFLCIKLFSNNDLIPCKYESFRIKPGSTSIRFCVGREVNNIPIGLLIYSGRIQYNHWDEGVLTNEVAMNIFNQLYISYLENPILDLIYDLDFPEPEPKSHYIVRHELKWKSYTDYIHDMQSMLLVG